MLDAPLFPGEDFLSIDLPNHASQRFWILVASLGSGTLFFFILPLFLSKPSAKDGKKRELNLVAEISLTLLGLFCMIFLLLKTSNNQALARTVVEAPLLTAEECQYLIDMAHRVAAANAENNPNDDTLQRIPSGWRKDRHHAYPTTDLNLIVDPFTKEDRSYIESLLNRRLSPLYERLWGIHAGAVRANDMFIVRYDADRGQPFLNKHTDSSHISFNVLLNDEFEGGGTRFHHRLQQSHKDVHPSSPGNVILNPAILEHEGLPTTNGTRYIFVGFTSVDPYDPFQNTTNSLSLFASWLCLNWCQVRFGEAYDTLTNRATKKKDWANNRYVKSLFSDIHTQFTAFGDWWAPHRVLRLVDNQDRNAYLQAMDVYYNASHDDPSKGRADFAKSEQKQANWFAGQQVSMDVDGTIANVWMSRRDNEDAFRDL